ncbi:GD10763 [Drosophila simulans]|uniref:GD10763 n=1 Tax=Drosophila simulans TaxID=7240 RepID=B4QAP8_DROSI|nr:GD10763 [Drosophila simulans]
MLDGWYCRSLANQEDGAIKDEPPSDDEPAQPARDRVPPISRGAAPASSSSVSAGLGAGETDFKERYKNLKKKLKFLIYENEYFQDLLHTNQRRLLKVSRDRTFLLDRLLVYEKPAKDSSDSDATDSSDSEPASTSGAAGGSQTSKDAIRRKHKDKGAPGIPGVPPHMPTTVPKEVWPVLSQAEIARQLQERRPTPLELMSPECTSATVPTTMLSDESPSKCYPNESLQHLMEDDSHSHEVAAEECVPMEYTS